MGPNDTGVFTLTHRGLRSEVHPVVLEDPRPLGRFLGRALKRPLDVVLAGLLLVVTAPVLLVSIALVRLTSRGPAIFVQRRIGYRCEAFSMYKLRTMVDGAEVRERELARRSPGRTFFKLEDDPRITAVGRVLRKLSIDELPQLVNVLRGQMSLVGPRPLLVSDFEKFPRSRQQRRFAVRPGLTGLWQVSGRSLLDDAERIRLDCEYVDRWSLALDLSILVRTVPAVFSTRGAT